MPNVAFHLLLVVDGEDANPEVDLEDKSIVTEIYEPGDRGGTIKDSFVLVGGLQQ